MEEIDRIKAINACKEVMSEKDRLKAIRACKDVEASTILNSEAKRVCRNTRLYVLGDKDEN